MVSGGIYGWLRSSRSVVLVALALLTIINPWVMAGHLDTSPAVLSLRTNPNIADQVAIRGISARNATGPNDIPVGVTGRTTGDAAGNESIVVAVRGEASGNAVGDDSRVDAIRGMATGNATGTRARVRGVLGFLTGNAEGTNAQLVGVQGNVEGNATGPNSRVRAVTATAEGSASGTNASIEAVLGFAGATSGIAIGGNFTAEATSGLAIGGTFTAAGSPSRGVIGNAIAPSGDAIGVLGHSQSPDGVAVQGNGDNGAKAGLFNGRVDINCSGGSPCLVVNGAVIGDLAEDMPAVGDVDAADVVVLTQGNEGVGVVRASRPYDTRVAGIISTNPRIRFGSTQGKNHAAVAMVGIVPARATASNGPIVPGDLLTTSSIPGHVMRCPSAARERRARSTSGPTGS